MNIKSETEENSLCYRYKKSFYNGDLLTIFLTLFMLTCIIVFFIKLDNMTTYFTNKFTYSQIVDDKPILKCGNGDLITNKNYQAFSIGDDLKVRVYNSQKNYIDYSPEECDIVRFDLNEKLALTNIQETITNLQEKVKKLETINAENIEVIKHLSEEKDKKIAMYKLPTNDELEKLYTDFKSSKRNDFNEWINHIKNQELSRLKREKSLINNVNHDDCYNIAVESDYPKAYELWLAGDCNKLRKKIQYYEKNKLKVSK